jgi:hypothetical protein
VLGERERRLRFVLRDRDAKFSRAFDDVFRSDGIEVLITPVQAPNANAYAERWIRTVRAECLDWLLIIGRGHLQQVLRVYIEHYTPIAHTGRSGCSRWIQLSNLPSQARIRRPKSTGATCSTDSCTSTEELHERICAPYGDEEWPPLVRLRPGSPCLIGGRAAQPARARRTTASKPAASSSTAPVTTHS